MSNFRFLRLLVFWLLACIPANGSTINCGCEGCLHYLETLDGLLLLVKQKIVNRSLFCQAVEFYAANGCFSHVSSHEDDWRTGEQFCSKDFSQIAYVQTNQLRGRKLLLHSLAAPPNSGKFNRHAHLSLSPGKFTIAVPIAFFLCCAFLCPCFRAKRRAVSEPEEVSQVTQPIELHTMDSVSSMDMSTRSDRISGSPYRVPPSARVPPSPSRSSMSQSFTRAVHLSISHIVKATQNFSPVHLIGEGGFGTVYKAQLPDGLVVAVKRAKKASFAIEQSQFNNEVELLSKLEHRSLVRLLGCIDKGNERLIITEYVPNGTLREHLDGQHGRILDFSQRLEISIDVAHALTYLHLYAEKPIIHRDVKSSNILLTESFRAKVADFGFARSGSTDEDKTHVSTKVKGTFGYLDPDYLKTNQLTPKSDVYSFGILLVEILSARRPVEAMRPSDERITVRWAFRKFTEGEVAKILDPALGEVVDIELVAKMLSLAFQCAAPVRNDRPTMKKTVEDLWEIRREYTSLGRG